MDTTDRYIEKNEQDANTGRLPHEAAYSNQEKDEPHEPIARTSTASSSSSSSTTSSVADRDGNMSRIPTQRDTEVGLAERHATALSRIQTQRSQHSSTVGAGLRSRISKKPLPVFGAGKPFPPPLPDREGMFVKLKEDKS